MENEQKYFIIKTLQLHHHSASCKFYTSKFFYIRYKYLNRNKNYIICIDCEFEIRANFTIYLQKNALHEQSPFRRSHFLYFPSVE